MRSLGFGSCFMAHGLWLPLSLWLPLQKRKQHAGAHEGFAFARSRDMRLVVGDAAKAHQRDGSLKLCDGDRTAAGGR